MATPYRIITVCTGNICRSPMAEFMLAKAFADECLDGEVQIDSAAMSKWEVGNPIDHRAAATLASRKLATDGHVARQFERAWFAQRDLILALDDGHLQELRELAPDEQSAGRVHLLRGFDPDAPDDDLSIADPWYGSSQDFERTWVLIEAAVPGVVGYVEKQLAARGKVGFVGRARPARDRTS